MIAYHWHAWLDHGRSDALEPELVSLMPALVAKARRLLGNASDAEDAVQDAMVELLRNRSNCARHVPLAAILHRLTTERALMYARGATRRTKREHAADGLAEAFAATPLAMERMDLSRLTPRQRVVVEALAGGATTQDAAILLGTTTSNIHVLLHRARIVLREQRSSRDAAATFQRGGLGNGQGDSGSLGRRVQARRATRVIRDG